MDAGCRLPNVNDDFTPRLTWARWNWTARSGLRARMILRGSSTNNHESHARSLAARRGKSIYETMDPIYW